MLWLPYARKIFAAADAQGAALDPDIARALLDDVARIGLTVVGM